MLSCASAFITLAHYVKNNNPSLCCSKNLRRDKSFVVSLYLINRKTAKNIKTLSERFLE